MARYVEDRRSTLFVKGSLETLLPAHSTARVIWGALESLDFAAFDASYSNDATGRPALNARSLAGVWILALVRGITSSVALARQCGVDIEFRWLLGDAEVEKSTLSDFRKRHLESLRDLSTQILAALGRSGLLPAEDMVVDGSIIRAAASCNANVSRKRLREKVERLRIAIESKLCADDAQAPSLDALDKCKARLESALAEMDELGLRTDDDRITKSEPEASLKRLKGGGFAPAHNVQAVVDATSGAIVSLEIVEAGNDQGQLEPQVKAAQAELERVAVLLDDECETPGPIRHVCADAAYHDTLQLKSLESRGIGVVAPDGQSERNAPGVGKGFEAEAFVYDEMRDVLICPEGQTLARWGLNDGHTAVRYRAQGTTCAACPSKASCCPNADKTGRSVNRPMYPRVLEAVAQRVQSPLGQRLLKARRVTAEGVFARLVEHLTWRRCRTWGRQGAKAEALWRQIAHNLLLLTRQWAPLALKTG